MPDGDGYASYWSSDLSYDADMDVQYPGENDECGYAHGYWYQVNRRYSDTTFFKRFFWWDQIVSMEAGRRNSSNAGGDSETFSGVVDYESTPEEGEHASERDDELEHSEIVCKENTTEASDVLPPDYVEDGDYDNDYVEIDLVVRAMADYERRDDTELSLREGELIRVLRQDVSGWWSGCKESETGQEVTGWFPSNFVHEKHLIWGIEEVDEEEGEAFPEGINI